MKTRGEQVHFGVVMATVTMVLFLLFFFGAGSVSAAAIEAPAAPDANDSAMYSTDDIYNRLNNGAMPAKRTGGFVGPSAAPGSSRKNLNEIMAVSPMPDNVTGAAPADVVDGKTFWGLRTDGSWGLLSGAGGANFLSPLAKSGQTTSYAAGDDGDLEKGVAWPAPRFTDNGNGTVTDKQSGLIWLKNANCFGTQTWANALIAANTLNSGECGLNDSSVEGAWRLPERKELFSLIAVQYYSPALSNTAGTGKWTAGDPFSGVQSSYYWSATTYAGSTDYAWIVGLYYGNVFWHGKANASYVWPVRGGQ